MIKELQSKVNVLEQHVNYQEDYSRCDNMQITDLQEQSRKETWEQTAANVRLHIKPSTAVYET